LSDRYVEESGGEIRRLQRALFPFAVEVDPESLVTWRLQVGKEALTTPIPHPGATLLNYLTRSVSGLRPKDAGKVIGTPEQPGLAPRILAVPGMKEWLFDGPGRSTLHFAAVLHGLRQPRNDQQPLRLADGVLLTPVHPDTLDHDEAFMYMTPKHTPLEQGGASLQAAKIKARGLHAAERNERIVDLWQRFMENFIGPILHNR
jgi:hypothetical protein